MPLRSPKRPPSYGLRTALLVAAALLAAGAGHADGVFVWRGEQADIVEPEQKALVVFQNGWEELTLEVRYDGAPGEFGWIVPVPARPELCPADSELFRWLSMETQRRRVGRSLTMARRGATAGAAAGGVSLLERKSVGIYDAAVLTADRGSALQAWLRRNGFRAPAGAGPVFQEYATRGWVFVALRILPAAVDSTTGRRLAAGTIQPIRLRFPTAAPVFPLRISALGGDSTDLLVYAAAGDPLVPVSAHSGRWESTQYGPMSKSLFDPDSNFAPDGKPALFLSKIRARLGASEMEDLYFQPYDPRAGLASPEIEKRVEAASIIGWTRRRELAGHLVRFLEPGGADAWGPVSRHVPGPLPMQVASGQDVQSALWALGELGTPAAVECLLRWAGKYPGEASLEAFDSLVRLKEHAALPLALQWIRRTAQSEVFDAVATLFSERALDLVLALGDTTCLPALRELSLQHPTTPSLEPPRGSRAATPTGRDELGPRLLVARAACGDWPAWDYVRQSVVSGAGVTTEEATRAEVLRFHSDNDGYPEGFRVAQALRHREAWYLNFWPALHTVMEGLGTRPALRDSLLRRCAGAPEIPTPGRVLLLGLLASPRAADRAALETLGRASPRVPVRAAPRPMPEGDCVAPAEAYDLTRCALVTAWTRWGDAPALRRLLARVPLDDSTLRGEIVTGLALCGQPEDAEIIGAYAAEVWSSRAERPEYRERQARCPGLRPRRGIDLLYRSDAMARYLSRVPGSDRVVWRLLDDARLSPRERLDFLELLIEIRPERGRLSRARAAWERIRARCAAEGPDVIAVQEAAHLLDLLEARLGGAPTAGAHPSP